MRNACRSGGICDAFPLLSVERQICVLDEIFYGEVMGSGKDSRLVNRLHYLCQFFLSLRFRHFRNPAQDFAFEAPFSRAIILPVLAHPVPTIPGFSYTTILEPLSHVTPLNHSVHGLRF